MTSALIRGAVAADLDGILDLAAERRGDYERYQPRFWRPAADAATRQAPYLAGLIADPSAIALVAVNSGDRLVGFVIAQVAPAPPVYDPGGLSCMVDDFAVSEPGLWATVGAELLAAVAREARVRGAVQVVVVTAARDDPKRAALDRSGLSLASEWWVGPLGGVGSQSVRSSSTTPA